MKKKQRNKRYKYESIFKQTKVTVALHSQQLNIIYSDSVGNVVGML